MRTAITGGTALVGRELAATEATIVVEGTHIASIDEARAATTFDARGMTLLPGFIDAHVHIGFYDPLDVLHGGVTTVRDLAWPADDIFAIARRSRDPGFPGPTIHATGPMLTVPGGYPLGAAWAPLGTGIEVETPEAGAVAVAELASRGAAAIKVALNAEVGPVLDRQRLRAIVSAAHEAGLKVTGHVYGLGELDKALDCGLDELAHMLMSPERIPQQTIDRMAASTVVVPTLSVRSEDLAVAVDNLRRFLDAGGRAVYGTDLGNEGPGPGIDERELTAMADAGLSLQEIVRSATVDAARWLGLDDVGVLEEGFAADIVAVEGHPSSPKDLTRIAAVWRSGRRAR